MGVYIKGMEMPKDCPMCHLSHWDFTGEFRGCKVVNGKKYAMETEPGYPETNYRPSWCPLVPVPDHGRLIDASEKIRVQMYDDMTEDFHMVDMTIDDLLSQGWIEANAPTIIEAEEGET